jgi:hypothetical protein
MTYRFIHLKVRFPARSERPHLADVVDLVGH